MEKTIITKSAYDKCKEIIIEIGELENKKVSLEDIGKKKYLFKQYAKRLTTKEFIRLSKET